MTEKMTVLRQCPLLWFDAGGRFHTRTAAPASDVYISIWSFTEHSSVSPIPWTANYEGISPSDALSSLSGHHCSVAR